MAAKKENKFLGKKQFREDNKMKEKKWMGPQLKQF